jgi:hypothetical protein
VELDEGLVLEWRADHHLSARSLRWIEDHAEPGDTHPIVSAIVALRALETE